MDPTWHTLFRAMHPRIHWAESDSVQISVSHLPSQEVGHQSQPPSTRQTAKSKNEMHLKGRRFRHNEFIGLSLNGWIRQQVCGS